MPNNNFKKFFLQFSIYILSILALSTILYVFLPQFHINRWFWAIILFLYSIGVLSFFMLSKSMEKKLSHFANVFMILNFVRLILFTVIIFAYAFTHKNEAVSFTLTFFFYYILTTLWEIFTLKKKN